MYAIHLHICPYPQPCLSIAALHPFHCRSTLYSMTCYHRLGILGKVDLEACFPFSIFWTWCFFPPVYILCYRSFWLLNRWLILIGDSGWWFTILACMRQVTLGMKKTPTFTTNHCCNKKILFIPGESHLYLRCDASMFRCVLAPPNS